MPMPPRAISSCTTNPGTNSTPSFSSSANAAIKQRGQVSPFPIRQRQATSLAHRHRFGGVAGSWSRGGLFHLNYSITPTASHSLQHGAQISKLFVNEVRRGNCARDFETDLFAEL